MKFLFFTILVCCVFRGAAAPADKPLDLNEVMEVLRTNLAGVDEAELKRAAARGLISQLRPRVTLVGDTPATNVVSTNLLGLHARVFDRTYGYIRLGNVRDGVDAEFSRTLKALTTNRLKGLAIDLRFSTGDNYAGAAAVADAFFSEERPLIDYGEGLRKSASKENAITIPIAVLVNAQTKGAAEALAGILRQNEAGLLLGETTAGEANIAKEVSLSSGQKLRISTVAVKVGNGMPLPASGLRPDVAVEVNPDDEMSYISEVLDDKTPTRPAQTNDVAASTNRNSPRRRINEAELVRMLRDGQNPDEDTSNRRASPPMPLVRDPVLARALDLLKGLAVVQQARPL